MLFLMTHLFSFFLSFPHIFLCFSLYFFHSFSFISCSRTWRGKNSVLRTGKGWEEMFANERTASSYHVNTFSLPFSFSLFLSLFLPCSRNSHVILWEKKGEKEGKKEKERDKEMESDMNGFWVARLSSFSSFLFFFLLYLSISLSLSLAFVSLFLLPFCERKRERERRKKGLSKKNGGSQ